ncbi:PQQ-binding-like beta-propeller repeat protein [Streptomyces uncialis]|uniref:outer membrane protein assembly factor BamB family protein n=1 Tax=Streptomyces uncialis TaxID=1048205 RepID=UPI0038091D00
MKSTSRRFLVIAVGVVAASTAVVVPYVLPNSDDGTGSHDGPGTGGGGAGGKSPPPRLLWNAPVAPETRLPDAAAGPVVVVSLPAGDVPVGFQVRDARSGKVLWVFKTVEGSDGDLESFSVDLDPEGTTAYIALPGGKVDARDATTGRTKWNYEMDRPESGGISWGTPSLAFADGVVYVTDLRRVSAVRSGNGGELWTVPLDDTTTTPVLVGQVLLVQALQHLYAVGVDEERVIWRMPTDQSALPIGGGIVFVTPRDTGATGAALDTLAIDIADGAERWSDPSAPHAVLEGHTKLPTKCPTGRRRHTRRARS